MCASNLIYGGSVWWGGGWGIVALSLPNGSDIMGNHGGTPWPPSGSSTKSIAPQQIRAR